MILVTGRVTAKPDITEMLRVSREDVHRPRKEPGWISHDVSVDADDLVTLHFHRAVDGYGGAQGAFPRPESRMMWRTLQALAADPGAIRVY